jgi:pre-mRNA-processing factor 6
VVRGCENAKTILANAVRHLPTSVKIWLQASDLEQSDAQKKIVLRRALEFIPNSVKLWKTAIELEDVSDARIMLARAVECVPHNVEMWLALAKLETHENARKVLNQAREAIPTEPATWITAAKLEEAHGNGNLVARIIEKMLASLAQYQVVISRDQWLKEAELAEHSGAIQTCRSLVINTIQIGVDEEDRKATWMDDADACLTHTNSPIAVETARAIYAYSLTIFPNKKSLWLAAAMLEKEHGDPTSLEAMLKDAVRHCPRAEIMWLMAAKEKWLSGNVPGARAILIEAFDANPESEQIWLAASKLEWENSEYQRARVLLSKARDRAPSERVWMKSALLEAEQGDFKQTLCLLDEGIAKYPTFAKFYMMAGQSCMEMGKGTEKVGDAKRARDYYQQGIKQCPTSVPLWQLVIRLEESVRGITKARSLMEIARLKLPLNEEIWLESIRLERRAGNVEMAGSLMAKALQDCPSSGILWAEEITTCSKANQKSKSVDALKKCDNDQYVIMAVAKLFEKDRKIPKARKWFDRAVALSPRLGDAWAHYYAFELRNAATVPPSSSSAEPALLSSDAVLSRCIASEPNRGELWCAVSKATDYRRSDVGTVLKKVVERMIVGAATVKPESGIKSEPGIKAEPPLQ